METDFSFNFLLGFLVFFVCLVFVLAFGFKSENISIYDKKKFNRNRIVQQIIWFLPFLLFFLYLLASQKVGLNEFLMLIFFPILFIFGSEYLLFQPKLNVLINDANRVFDILKYDGHQARYSFNAITDKLLLNRDKPEYIRGYLVDIHLDRVCKNNFGEYFWIQASASGSSEPVVRHLTPHEVKNLLRIDKDIYTQEFNEEPYFTS